MPLLYRTLAMLSASLCADVSVYEATSFPVEDNWFVVQNFCNTPEAVEDGIFVQTVDTCTEIQPPEGQQSTYRRLLDDFAGSETFFLEF